MKETISEKLDRAIQVAEGIIPALQNAQTAAPDIQKAAQAILNLSQAKAQYKALPRPTETLNESLAFVLGRVRPNLNATAMQQVTQAVLHLVAAKTQVEGADQPAKRGPGRPRKPTEVPTDDSEVKPDEQ